MLVKSKETEVNSEASLLIVLLLGLFLVGFGEPVEEGLGSLANLSRGVLVNVLLAGVSTPLGDHFLADEVVVVVQLQDLDNLRQELGVRVGQRSNKTLSASQKSLLVAFRVDNLSWALVIDYV